MWIKFTGQRELLEIVVGSKKVSANELQRTNEGLRGLHEADEPICVIWESDPWSLKSIPTAIIIRDDVYKKVGAMLWSVPQRPFPFSAMTRLLSREVVAQSQEWNAVRPLPVFRGLAGLVMAVLIRKSKRNHEGGRRLSLVESLDGIFAYRFSRILSSVGPRMLNLALQKSNIALEATSDPRLGAFITDEEKFFPVLSTAFKLASGEKDSSICKFCEHLISTGEDSERAWRDIAEPIGWHVTLSDFSRMNREDRVGCLKEFISLIRSSGNQDGKFCAAFLASRISPGTFDHFDMVESLGDQEVSNWYGFVACLQREGAALGYDSGLGELVLKHLVANQNLLERPVADITVDELMSCSQAELVKLKSRLYVNGRILVEVGPGVSFWFGEGPPEPKMLERSQGDRYLQGELLKEATREQAIYEDVSNKLSEVARLLKEVIVEMPKSNPKPPRSRAKKAAR